MKGLGEMDAQISRGMVEFGGFRLDVDLRRLLHQDAPGAWAQVAAGSRALDVLAVLLRQPGVLVTKDTIMQQVWPGAAVEAANLTVQITALRKVLDGNRASESCIQTVSGRGYRFVAPVTRLPAESMSELPSQSISDPKLPNASGTPAQSREHGRLVEGVYRIDLSSNPGTVIAAGPAEPRERRLEPRPAERRQLTVMACDVVGLAALSARLDLEDLCEVTTACHRRCADIIERYHGYVANYSTDGVLAYFGYPQADEHDAERAIQVSLALVEAMPKLTTAAGMPLHVSVGIATGMVVTSDPAMFSATQKVSLVGSTPNLAARLQGLAPADLIVIAASTRRLAGSAFELIDLGEHALNGISEPVHAWRVERALAAESRFDSSRGGSVLTPLVGREEEMDLLLRRWSQAKDGEGQVVLLSGEPGIGKSRILSTLRQRLEAQGVQALRFQCSPYYVNSAFWPIIDNFERTLKFTRDETANSKLDKLEALVVTHYGRPLADVRFVASILSIPCEASLRGYAYDAAEAQGRDAADLGRSRGSVRSKATQRDAVRGCALGRPNHAGGVGSADRPGENCPAAGRAHPPAGVPVALVRARPCRRTEPVQADPDAECRDGLCARRRQAATGGAARADSDQDRRRAIVCRGADQVHPRIWRAERGR